VVVERSVLTEINEDVKVHWALIHQKCQLRPQTHFSVYQSLGDVYGGCKCRSISVKRNLKIEENVVVSEYTICYRVTAYQNST